MLLTFGTALGTAVATLIYDCRANAATVYITNHSGGLIHVGGSAVNADNGYQIGNNNTVSFMVYNGDKVYGYDTNGGATVDVLVTAPNP
jgi:hypothetical protein